MKLVNSIWSKLMNLCIGQADFCYNSNKKNVAHEGATPTYYAPIMSELNYRSQPGPPSPGGRNIASKNPIIFGSPPLFVFFNFLSNCNLGILHNQNFVRFFPMLKKTC